MRSMKKGKLTTPMMEVAIADLFNPRKMKMIVPNVSRGLGVHECDMFIVRKSNYATEVEIKISIADLKKDFEKEHNHADVRIKDFYYAVPNYLLEKALSFIPPHAGIIQVRQSDTIPIANYVKAPISNRFAKKLTQHEVYKLARLGTLRIWNLKKKILRLNK